MEPEKRLATAEEVSSAEAVPLSEVTDKSEVNVGAPVTPESGTETGAKPETDGGTVVLPESGADTGAKPETGSGAVVPSESGADPEVKPEGDGEAVVKPETDTETNTATNTKPETDKAEKPTTSNKPGKRPSKKENKDEEEAVGDDLESALIGHEIDTEEGEETVPEVVSETTVTTEPIQTTEIETVETIGDNRYDHNITIHTKCPCDSLLTCLFHWGWLYLLIGLVIGLLIGVIMHLRFRMRQEKRRKEKQKHKHKRNASKGAAAEGAMPVTMPTFTEVSEGVAMTAAGDMMMTGSLQEVTQMGAVMVSEFGMRSAVFQGLGAREDQQDSYGMTDPALYENQGVLALVADGMGGLANGKAVSSALVNTFLGGFGSVSGYGKSQDILLDLAIRANYTINEHFRGADRSGSTLVSAMVRQGQLHFLTVGDSHIYLYRAGSLIQLNREHIYQEELAVKALNRQVPLGSVSTDRQAHALTSFFGIGNIPWIDRNDEPIKLCKGDRILLCSDGVFGTLTQEQMEYALRQDIREAATIMRDLIQEANRPYQDNNTGLILEYLG